MDLVVYGKLNICESNRTRQHVPEDWVIEHDLGLNHLALVVEDVGNAEGGQHADHQKPEGSIGNMMSRAKPKLRLSN